jgi:tape measure domain-containing protein
MADATLTLDAEINTGDWNAGVKDIQSGSRQIEESARHADEAFGNVDKSSSKSSSGLGKFGAAAGAVGGLVSSGIGMAVDAIGDLTGDIIEASDSADKFKSTLNFAGLDTGTIDALTASTQTYADQTVYSISDIRNVTAQLAANGVQGFDQLAEAAGNLNAVAGGNAETFSSVGMVLTQTAGAGKLTTENWNQLADAIPGASGKLQEAMLKNGAYTGNFRDAMEKGEISAEEFNQAIMDLGMTDAAKEAATSTSTIEGAMGNLQASVVGVGTTILDQFKGPLTSGISTLAQRISGLSGVFTGLVQTIGPILSQIGTTFQTAFQPVVGMVQSQLLPALKPLMSALQNIGNAIMPAIQPIASGLATVASIIVQTMSVISTAVTPVINNIASSIQTVLPALQPLMSALQNIGNAIMPIITAAIQTIAPVLSTIVSNIGQTMSVIATAVTPVINNIAALIQAVLPAIQSAFQIWGTYIQGVINAVFPFIQTVITSVMNVINAIISTVLAAINGDWSGVWEGIQNIVSSVWNGIQSIVSGAINAVSGVISSVLSGISGIFSSVWNGIKGAVSSAWSGITSAVSSGVSSMMNFITSIPSRIMGVFSGAGSWLLSAGQNIIQGLINGITNAIGGAISAVKDAVGGIIDGAKSLLGIASPSKVFDREIGRMIPAGLGRGVSENERAATRPVEDMVNSLLPSSIVTPMPVMSSPVPVNMNSGPRVSAPITVNALDPNAAAQETVRVINFHYV